MYRAKIEILGEKPMDEIISNHLLRPGCFPSPNLKSKSLSFLESLYHLIETHDCSKNENNFAYNLTFSSEYSFADLLTDPSVWDFMSMCTIKTEYSDPELKFTWTNIFFVDANHQVHITSANTDKTSTIHNEQNLAELTKKSEELFELASHLSPQMYGRVHEKVYNNLRDNMNWGGTRTLHEVIDLLVEDMKDRITENEY